MSRGFTPRHAQTAGDSGFAMRFNAKTMALRTAQLSSRRIVSRVTIGRVTPFIPGEKPNVKHSISGYLRLPWPTPPPAMMRELHWHHS